MNDLYNGFLLFGWVVIAIVVVTTVFQLALGAYFKAKERFVDRMLEKGRRNFDGEG